MLARAQALEAAGRCIIHFEIGQPDFDTFENISQAGITAIRILPNIKSYAVTSAELADFLLEEAGVAVLPGSAFGRPAEGYLRLSYATSRENIVSGLDQLQNSLAGIQ